MSKVCVIIVGTNAVGKSTLARELIRRYGGITEKTNTYSLCASGVCVAGFYDKTNPSATGIDGFRETAVFERIARESLAKHDILIAEGSYLCTFGMNIQNALFVAQKQLVVFLYAPIDVICARVTARSGLGLSVHTVKKQRQALRAAQKYASIGVPVLAFDTSKMRTEEIAVQVESKIRQLCSV